MKPEPTAGPALSSAFQEFRSRLLAWFDKQGRSLPWRNHRSLYGTWISEVMLQQTTVATVVPYWERFLAVFPDLATLAAADLDEVLNMWSGLGYYRRARQLHEAAQILVSRNNGQLPTDREGWLQLPGIGPYASGAIASIAFQQRVPALDANARRVLTRWLVACPNDLDDLRPARLETVGAELVDPDRPGDWNEAVMELGALICRAANPECGECPVRELCRAGTAGHADLIPPPKQAATVQKVQLGVLVLAAGNRILLMRPGCGPVVVPAGSPAAVRKDLSGLHQDLWGLPSTPWLPDPVDPGAVWPGGIWRPWLKKILDPDLWPPEQDPVLVGKFRHAITKYRLIVQVYGLRLPAAPFSGVQEGVLVSAAGKQGTSPRARFCRWPASDQPVSNLVKKSVLVAEANHV